MLKKSLIRKTPLMRVLPIALSLLIASGCSTTSNTHDQGERTGKKRVISLGTKPLPKVALNKSLLESLLVDRFAVYYSQWQTSLDASYQAAKTTGDWRLARRASEIGFTLAKDFPTSHEAASLWLDLQPNESEAQLYYVATGIAVGKQIELADVAVNYVKQHPKGEVEALSILSQYMRSQPNESALPLLRLMEDIFKGSADFMYEATLVNAWFKKDVLAREYLQKSLQLKPDHQNSIIFQYQLIAIEQDVAGANLYLREQIARFPKSKTLRNQHISNLYAKQQYAEVVSLTESLSRSSSKKAKDDAIAWYFRGASLVQLDQLREAENALSQVLRITPNDDSTRLQLGRVYFADGNYQKSLKVLSEIDNIDSEFHAGLLWAKATVAANPGDLGVARALRKLNGLHIDTKSKIIERALAQSEILEAAGKPYRAIGFLNDAVASYPKNDRLLYARGLIASNVGELAIAEEDLGTVIRQNPMDASSLNALGYTLLELSTRYSEAKVLIDRALQIEPNSFHILDSAGWAAYKIGDLDTALRYLRKAYAGAGAHPELAAHLAEVLYVRGNPQEARAILQESLKANPGNKVLNAVINKFN